MPIDYTMNMMQVEELKSKKIKGAGQAFDSSIYHKYIDNKEYGNAAEYLSQYTFVDENKDNKYRKMISDLRHRQTVRDYYKQNITDDNKQEKYLSAVDLVMDINSSNRVTGNGYYQTKYNEYLSDLGGSDTDTFRFYLDESLDKDKTGAWGSFKSRVYDLFTPASYSNETTLSMFNAIFGSTNATNLQQNYDIIFNSDDKGRYVDVRKDNPKLMEIFDKFSMLNYANHVNGKDEQNDRGNYPVVDDHGNETPIKWGGIFHVDNRFKIVAINSNNPKIQKEIHTPGRSDELPIHNSSNLNRLLKLVKEAKELTKEIDTYNETVDDYYGVEKSVDASTIYDATYLHPAEVLLDQLRERGAIDGPEYKRYRDQYDADIYDKLFTTFANAAQYPIYSNYTGKSGDDELSSIMSLVSNAKRQNLGDIVLKALNDKRGVEVRSGYTSGMYGAYIMIGPEANTGEAKKKDEFYRHSIKVFIPNFSGNEEEMFGNNADAKFNKEKWDLQRWHKDYTTLSGGYIENRNGSYNYYINGSAQEIKSEKALDRILMEDINLRMARSMLVKELTKNKKIDKATFDKVIKTAGDIASDLITENYGIEDPFNAFKDSEFRSNNEKAFNSYRRYYDILAAAIMNAYDSEKNSFIYGIYGAENAWKDHINNFRN